MLFSFESVDDEIGRVEFEVRNIGPYVNLFIESPGGSPGFGKLGAGLQFVRVERVAPEGRSDYGTAFYVTLGAGRDLDPSSRHVVAPTLDAAIAFALGEGGGLTSGAALSVVAGLALSRRVGDLTFALEPGLSFDANAREFGLALGGGLVAHLY